MSKICRNIFVVVLLLVGSLGCGVNVEYSGDGTSATVSTSSSFGTDFDRLMKLAKQVHSLAASNEALTEIRVVLISKGTRTNSYGEKVKYNNEREFAVVTNLDDVRRYATGDAYARRVVEYNAAGAALYIPQRARN